MKQRKLVYLPAAERDLDESVKYIFKDSPASAAAWLQSIDEALSRLASFPESGVVPRNARLAARGYRVVVIGQYLAFYVLKPGDVEIRRVLRGRRRYAFLLP